MIPAMLATVLAASVPPPEPPSRARALVTVIETRVMRIIAAPPHPALPPQTPPGLREARGPRCVEAGAIAGAAVAGPTTVDLFLRGGARVRARLEAACPALDFYRGFYVKPGADGRLCADRDAIRTRSGGACGIDRFRRLLPAPPP